MPVSSIKYLNTAFEFWEKYLYYRAMESVEEKDLIKVRSGRDASFFDLYSIDQLSQPDLDLIFDLARKFRQYQTYKFSLAKGCSMVNAFFEASTRTLISFDLSGKNLSMDTS